MALSAGLANATIARMLTFVYTGSSAKAGHTPKNDGVVSMAQKVMMEQEREKAIERYRLLRASQRKGWGEGDGEREDSDG